MPQVYLDYVRALLANRPNPTTRDQGLGNTGLGARALGNNQNSHEHSRDCEPFLRIKVQGRSGRRLIQNPDIILLISNISFPITIKLACEL